MIEVFKTARLLLELRRSTQLAGASLRGMQGKLLTQVVAHAADTVPFYRRVWREAGFDPARVRTVDDLALLPIITPAQVRAAANSGELLARGVPDDLPRFATSGSSDSPIQVPRGAVEARLWRAGGLRIQFEHGFRWWETTVQFGSGSGPGHPLQKFGIAPALWISDEIPVEDQIEALQRTHARFIWGHVTALRQIGLALLEGKARITPPRVVLSLAEVLDEGSRATIRQGLGVDPLNVYGMSEAGYIAWQCERREGLHVSADAVIVEILRGDIPAGPGELGRVVVTDLRGRTMPLLRYDTGDLATAGTGPCPCGRTLPIMGPVEGRASHAMRAAGGQTLTQRGVMNHLAGTLKMGEYRLEREPTGVFRLQVTPNAYAPGAGETDVRRALTGLFGAISVEFETVAAFPRTAKTYAVINA